MVGIKALFTGRQIANVFNSFQEKIHDEVLLKLQYIGEEFVNKARTNDTYQDDTGNLRSSIGYIIILDGDVINMNFEGEQEGKSKGKKIANEVADIHPDGYVLIGVAGMNYAASVEVHGFDVITGAAPEVEYLRSIFDENKF